MQALRAVFDPEQRCNPGKIFPTPGGVRRGDAPAQAGRRR